MNQMNDARRELIEKGLSTYADAQAAIAQFEDEIVSVLRDELTTKLGELAKALAIKPSHRPIKALKRPNDHILFVSHKLTTKTDGPRFYLWVEFPETREDELLAGATLTFWTPAAFAAARQVLQQGDGYSGPTEDGDDGFEVYVKATAVSEEALRAALRAAVEKWIAIAKDRGGLKGLRG